MPDVFLSYSREDQPTARRFAQALEREGLTIWWDQALTAGEAFDQVTEQSLREALAVVVLWSRHSVESRWVRAEATQAQTNRRLVPVMIESCTRPIMFELTHTADLADWKGDAADPRWRSFVEGLRKFVDRSSASVTATLNAPAADAPATAREPAARSVPRRLIGWAVAAVALVIAAGTAWHLHGKASGTAAADEVSIAVLPFDDMSPQKDQGYFADGVAEEILNQLASIDPKQLRVIARNSSFAMRGKDVRTAGQELNVGHVLEGSVRRDGDQLRVTAQLIDTKTDAHLWSRIYNRPRADVFAVQEEIARAVAGTLQVSLGVGFGQKPGYTRNVEAWDAALEALSLIPQSTPDSRRRAIELLQQAVARDQDFGFGWAWLADLYGQMPGFGIGNPGDWQQKSDAAFKEFMRVMPAEAEVVRHERLARSSAAAGRLKEAAGHYHDAYEARARLCRCEPPEGREPADFLISVGRTRDAIQVLEQERARDPLSPSTAAYLVMAYGEAGDFKAAFAEAERGDKLGEAMRQMIRGMALGAAFSAGDRAQVRRWLELGAAIVPDAGLKEFNTQLAALVDKPKEALAYLTTSAREISASGTTQSIFVPFFAYFGDSATALRFQRAAFEKGAGGFGAWGPVMRDVRKLPGFKKLALEEGLVDYWRAYGWGDYCKPVRDGSDFECL